MEAISNWFEMSADGMEINNRKQKEKFLTIWMDDVENAREMIDHLKMVYLIDFVNKISVLMEYTTSFGIYHIIALNCGL